jgi:hypothetical protein
VSLHRGHTLHFNTNSAAGAAITHNGFYSIFLVAKPKFRIGDKVKVVGMSPVTFPLGVKDELGTEKPFR